MPSRLSVFFQTHTMAFWLVEKTRPSSERGSARRTETAFCERGTAGGTPLFPWRLNSAGIQITWRGRSIQSHRSASNMPWRREVSIARSTAGRTHGFSDADSAADRVSYSPARRRRSRSLDPDGFLMFFSGVHEAFHAPLLARDLEHVADQRQLQSHGVLAARPRARRSSLYFAKSTPRMLARK